MKFMELVNLFEKYVLSPELQTIFKDKVPLDVEEDVDVDVEGDFIVFKGRKTEKLNIGKGLRKRLYPDLTDAELADAVRKLKQSGGPSSEYEVKIRSDVSAACSSYKGTFLKSCINDHPEVIPFYDTQPSLRILELFKHGKKIGRALLWSKVEGARKGLYMDRTYPAGDEEVGNVLRQFAKKNDWTYRTEQGYDDYEDISNHVGNGFLKYRLENSEKIELVPYMDTFRYALVGGVMTNDSCDSLYNFLYKFDSSVGTKIPKLQMASWDKYMEDPRLIASAPPGTFTIEAEMHIVTSKPTLFNYFTHPRGETIGYMLENHPDDINVSIASPHIQYLVVSIQPHRLSEVPDVIGLLKAEPRLIRHMENPTDEMIDMVFKSVDAASDDLYRLMEDHPKIIDNIDEYPARTQCIMVVKDADLINKITDPRNVLLVDLAAYSNIEDPSDELRSWVVRNCDPMKVIKFVGGLSDDDIEHLAELDGRILTMIPNPSKFVIDLIFKKFPAPAALKFLFSKGYVSLNDEYVLNKVVDNLNNGSKFLDEIDNPENVSLKMVKAYPYSLAYMRNQYESCQLYVLRHSYQYMRAIFGIVRNVKPKAMVAIYNKNPDDLVDLISQKAPRKELTVGCLEALLNNGIKVDSGFAMKLSNRIWGSSDLGSTGMGLMVDYIETSVRMGVCSTMDYVDEFVKAFHAKTTNVGNLLLSIYCHVFEMNPSRTDNHMPQYLRDLKDISLEDVFRRDGSEWRYLVFRSGGTRKPIIRNKNDIDEQLAFCLWALGCKSGIFNDGEPLDYIPKAVAQADEVQSE